MRQRIFIFVSLIFLAGCTTTQKAATVGGVGGAALGTIIGHQSDHDLTGAAIGGAAGTVAGMIIGEKMEKKFCPVCGRAYTADQKFCPVDGTELKDKGQ